MIDTETGEITETVGSLIKLDEATRYLAEVKSVDEVKDIRDKAEAMRVYAKQAQLGLESQNYAAEIKLRAERRAGELLAEIDRVPRTLRGAMLRTEEDAKLLHETPTYMKTIRENGIEPRAAQHWQSIARMPETVFEAQIAQIKSSGQELTTSGIIRAIKAETKEQRREEKQERKEAIPEFITRDAYRLLTGDLLEVSSSIDDQSIDWIITDPPYPKEFIPEYEKLARLAQRVLKPGGSLLVMCGQSYLPDIMERMTPYLRYHWTLTYLTPGGQAVQLWDRHVNTFWKPILWFVNGDYNGDWIGDVSKSAVNDNDKRFHDWGQSESGMADLVERFTYPGETILDPFMGAGTTGVVAVRGGRQFIGIDIDAACVATAEERLCQIAQ